MKIYKLLLILIFFIILISPIYADMPAIQIQDNYKNIICFNGIENISDYKFYLVNQDKNKLYNAVEIEDGCLSSNIETVDYNYFNNYNKNRFLKYSYYLKTNVYAIKFNSRDNNFPKKLIEKAVSKKTYDKNTKKYNISSLNFSKYKNITDVFKAEINVDTLSSKPRQYLHRTKHIYNFYKKDNKIDYEKTEKKTINHLVIYWLIIAFVLTVLIEFFVFSGFSKFSKKNFKKILLINAISWPLVIIFYNFIFLKYLFYIEIFAILLEFLLIKKLTKFSFIKSLLISFLINFTSWFIATIINFMTNL